MAAVRSLMPKSIYEHENLTYDFERDEWVEYFVVQPKWIERELPKPKTAPEAGQWYGPEIRRRRPPDGFLILIGTVFASLCGFALFGLAAPLVVGFFGLFCVIRSSQDDDANATEADLRLVENPHDPDVCLVKVTLYKHGSPCANDRGVVWFEGGRLLFAGHRTSFAIGGEDVLPLNHLRPEAQIGQPNKIEDMALFLRTDGPLVHVTFTPIRHDGAMLRQYSRFYERLRVFRLRPPESRGPRQWPPFDP